MGISVPEEFGGLGLSTRTQLVAIEEVARTDAALASIYTAHYLGLEPILVGGSEEQKHRWLPQLASGELLAGFALTEPDAGSDIASMRTVARREDDGWHLAIEEVARTDAALASIYVACGCSWVDLGVGEGSDSAAELCEINAVGVGRGLGSHGAPSRRDS